MNESLITSVPPPSELPFFITSEPLPSTDKVEKSRDIMSPPSQPIVSTMVGTTGNLGGEPTLNTSSITSSESAIIIQSELSSRPITIQPLPPVCSDVDDSSEPSDPAPSPNSKYDWVGWLKGTVHSVGNKVVEKAKTSMDSMITTLDPQMREFINSGGDIDVIVASDKEVKINPVREAFQKVFGKATVSGFKSESSSIAAQPVGFESALKSAEERINFVRNSGKIHPQQTVVAVENFITEFQQGLWVEMGLLLLDDPWHDIILQTYTQTTPVPPEYIEEAKSSTMDTYEFKNSGFSITIGQIASKHLNVHHTMWQETLTGVSRRESILLAAKALGGLYQSRLPKDVI